MTETIDAIPQAISQLSPSATTADTETALFASFGLDQRLLDSVLAKGYTQATPIQTQAISLVMQGFDVMGAAQTGTGKTAAFALPILHRLLPMASSSPSPARHPVKALILAPTRELADQIYENVRDYAKGTPLRTTVIFGGMDFKPQEAALRAGVDVLIATPGRLLDHVASKVLNLSQVNMLVLDEADRMLDMGFMPDLDRIVALLPKVRQTLLFSATFSEEIRKLAKTFLTQTPHYIEVAKRNATADNVKQRVIEVQGNKEAALIALLKQNRDADGKTQQTIVFVNSKLGASRIARHLQRVHIRAEAIHGDRSQQERLLTLNAFKSGAADVLVATDVAARGLDIPAMPCVINYDVPFHAEDYVHRIGRTGRAGASGAAYTLYTLDDARNLADVERFIKRTIERETIAAPADIDREERDRLHELRKRRHESVVRGEQREHSHPERLSNRQAPQQNKDPLFSQLYVPSDTTRGENNATNTPGTNTPSTQSDTVTETKPKTTTNKNKTVLAALFGPKN